MRDKIKMLLRRDATRSIEPIVLQANDNLEYNGSYYGKITKQNTIFGIVYNSYLNQFTYYFSGNKLPISKADEQAIPQQLRNIMIEVAESGKSKNISRSNLEHSSN